LDDPPQCSKNQPDYLKLVADGFLFKDGLAAYKPFIPATMFYKKVTILNRYFCFVLFFSAGMMVKKAVRPANSVLSIFVSSVCLFTTVLLVTTKHASS